MTIELNELGLPSVLSHLGKLTTIRETYLVEQSLLRTLGPLLGVLRTSLYRLNEYGAVTRSLHYTRSAVMGGEGVARVVEEIEEISRDDGLTFALRGLFDSVRMLGKPCAHKDGNELTMCYPILCGNDLRGFFVFEREHEAMPAENAVIAGVLKVFTNYYDLLDTSQRDRLTGLLNRYSLELNLDRLWTMLSVRRQLGSADVAEGQVDADKEQRVNPLRSYWFGIIDIDYFKKINDSHGHIIGDEVLILVARVLEKSFRSSDLLYRYGGEEFIAIIAADDLESATQVFERVRSEVEAFHFPQVGRVTISTGFSDADPNVLPQEIINRADRALYEAKRDGRNCVYHYDTLVERGVLHEVVTGSVDLWEPGR